MSYYTDQAGRDHTRRQYLVAMIGRCEAELKNKDILWQRHTELTDALRFMKGELAELENKK